MTPDHQQALQEAIALEGQAHRLLLDGRGAEAAERLRAASALYRRSWELAPPRSFGRLIGMAKAALIAGGAEAAVLYLREQAGAEGDSPPSWYAVAIAALAAGDDALAARAAEGMRAGGGAFERTADAIAALAARDGAAYGAALDAIVADFAARDAHLTGVPIADTALMLERLAADRGLGARPDSPLVPALP
jgi:hypothetical protein